MRRISLLFSFVCIFSFNQAVSQVQLALNTASAQTKIDRNIYGHFSEHLGRCIYDGFWVGDSVKVPKKDRIRLDIVDALKKIQIPNLRWPGGCFADEYHWRDGVGPRAQRPKMVNTNWVVLLKTIALAPMNFWSFVSCCKRNH